MAELFLRKHRWAELSVACSWHNFLCHGGSTNARSSPRLGVFSRWHHKDMHLSPPVEPPDFEVRLSASVHCTAHPNPRPAFSRSTAKCARSSYGTTRPTTSGRCGPTRRARRASRHCRENSRERIQQRQRDAEQSTAAPTPLLILHKFAPDDCHPQPPGRRRSRHPLLYRRLPTHLPAWPLRWTMPTPWP